MKHFKLFFLIFSITFLCASHTFAQEGHGHQAKAKPKRIGSVHFAVTCSSAQQKAFDHAVALLHSFWYEEANKAFTEIANEDPPCAMAYWGIAMSYFHPLWEPPDSTALTAGWVACQKAQQVGGRTDHERDYIAAITAFYEDAPKTDHRFRLLAYEKKMEALWQKYPTDEEAGIFYALALDATALPTDKTFANQKKAGAILEKVFQREPNHPGIAHYIIHSYDSPPLADRALSAARSYAEIAPAVPHALHMPSHIFTRLGLWQESISSNIASYDQAKEYSLKNFFGQTWGQQLHAMDYLEYAYLQTGQDKEARQLLDEAAKVTKTKPEDLASAYALCSMPARFAIEQGRWHDAVNITAQPSTFPWSRYPICEAIIHYAHALGEAHLGNVSAANKEIEKMMFVQKTLTDTKQNYWADYVDVLEREASAWTLHAEGKNDSSITLMREAADREDKTGKHPVSPGSIVPARELLACLLLEVGKPGDALREYKAALVSSPGRFNALFGAARAAELSGDKQTARSYYAKLVSYCDKADGSRTELTQAQHFLETK